MTVSLEAMLAEESEESRARIQVLAQEMREEISLRELRRQRNLTQARLAKKLKIGQEGVSRIERRQDMSISTLHSYIEGIGGKLSFVVDIPGQTPFVLSRLGSERSKKKALKKTKTSAKSKARERAAA
jgi:transcriptional regulator with XRE-family HTH domain